MMIGFQQGKSSHPRSWISLILIVLTSIRLDTTNAFRFEPKPNLVDLQPGIMPPPTDIRMVFSDVDGTLVHYPDSLDDDTINDDDDILRLPPSATGMQGIISGSTLAKCQQLRTHHGIKLVLVSGMRTSTLLKRLPYLPLADAYCSEAGGRIFLRRDEDTGSTSEQLSFTVTPQSYRGANPNDLKPFEIVEDLQWRRRMCAIKAAGKDGYVGAELDCLDKTTTTPTPIQDRKGALWEFARQLMAQGYVLDTKGYASCFRVNQKQQTQVSPQDFEALLEGKALPCPPELGTSVNLGCIDYYPVESGKKNCCHYLATKFLGSQSQALPLASNNNMDLLSAHCVCLCDDDNDLEMALACQHAFIPGISSDSMAQTIANNPQHFSVTGSGSHGGGTLATEKALSILTERIENQLRP